MQYMIGHISTQSHFSNLIFSIGDVYVVLFDSYTVRTLSDEIDGFVPLNQLCAKRDVCTI